MGGMERSHSHNKTLRLSRGNCLGARGPFSTLRLVWEKEARHESFKLCLQLAVCYSPSLGLGLVSQWGDIGCLALPQSFALGNEVSSLEVLWKEGQGLREVFGNYRQPH